MSEAHSAEEREAVTVLSRIVLPQDIAMSRSQLYYRADGNAILKNGALWIENGTKVQFNTYFNGFFYSKYLRYTHIKTIYMSISLMGCFTARICCQHGGTLSTVSETKLCGNLSDAALPVCDLESLPQAGALFLELEAHSPEAYFLKGEICTTQAPRGYVKIAAVICTYRRENYVWDNLKKIDAEIYNICCPITNDIDIFVVDNGQTLPSINHPHIHRILNRNWGGSGGFTRGILEAMAHKGEYSHVLLMDDDITFEVESIVKTVQLLKYGREMDCPLCIGGQMLLEDAPTIQFESGGLYEHGRLRAVNRGLDLSEWENVLENEKEHNAQYNAWWYCVFPLQILKRIGLPLPLFIKTDDVEYGLRMQPYVLLMNGIGVWHKAFEEKYSPYLEYYIKRNELVVSALHENRYSALAGMWKMIRAAGKAILVGTPKTVDYLMRAYHDFLEGPDFFLRTDAESLNDQLRKESDLPGKGRLHSLFTDPFRLIPVLICFAFQYRTVQKSYRLRLGELTSIEFWVKCLGLA